MEGQAQIIKKDDEEEIPDFEILEEGSPEAKALAKGGKVEDDEDESEEHDATLARAVEDPNDVNKTAAQQTESKRKTQRQRLKEKLDQKDGLIQSLQAQTRAQAQRLDALERRSGSNEIAMLDKAIADTRSLVDMTEQAHAQSLTQNDPLQVTKSMKDLFSAQRQLEILENAKVNAGRAITAPRPTDPTVARNITQWMDKNPWFRPETRDEDSRIAKVIDDQIAEEGFDPSTPAYWQELDRRIKRRLPHRASGKARQVIDDDEDDDSENDRPIVNAEKKQSRSHVSGSGQGNAGGGRVKVTLSRERIQALKDAGKWDDPVERNKMVRQYVKYDRENVNS